MQIFKLIFFQYEGQSIISEKMQRTEKELISVPNNCLYRMLFLHRFLTIKYIDTVDI